MTQIIRSVIILLTCIYATVHAQPAAIGSVLVNQAGYNAGEAKRLVAWGVADGTGFIIRSTKTGKKFFEGRIHNFSGDFTSFEPGVHTDEFVAEVAGLKPSLPFRIKPFLMELISTKLAYDFFMDVRGSTDPVHSNEANVYGGGPSRDCGAYTLETVFETMLYASNPALFDNWKNELGNGKTPDLIALILWHAEFAYHHHTYNGPVATRHGWLGYEGTPKMQYDYWNTLDQLAAVCAAYHSFLKPYLSEEKYKAYRKVCNDKWEEYERHKVVRYWTYSNKWVDSGYQEFNEMGNAYGQSVFSNLFMYLTELNEKDGQPEKYLAWAQESTVDIIRNWDFSNIRHMWWIRNAEHITPQALSFFLMTLPDKAPPGTAEKLNAWTDHILAKSQNPWHYRVHSETEWAHPKTKELGGAPALGGSLFAAAHVLNRPAARPYAWSQINFTFGLNPLGAHFSNKSKERLAINGYWEGVEYGWPQAHPDGYGMLGLVRGTLDGTPLDKDFPSLQTRSAVSDVVPVTDKIGMNAYATEGWAISNRGWMSTITFSTLHSISVKITDRSGSPVKEFSKGTKAFVTLNAPLNIDPSKIEKAWVMVKYDNQEEQKLKVTETAADSGIFTAPLNTKKASEIVASYGYWGFRKEARSKKIRTGKP
jgi:hypothetical protein